MNVHSDGLPPLLKWTFVDMRHLLLPIFFWEREYLKPAETARFFSKSGALTAAKKNEWIGLDFPAEPPTGRSCTRGAY